MRSQKLTTDQVLEVFTDELTSRDGKITDTFNDGRRLFCRSVLPLADSRRPGDAFHGGLALKATDEQICIYPYTFRLVCRNGAIHSQSIGSLSIEGLDDLAPQFILQSLRDGIDICSAREIFHDTMNKIRGLANREVNHALDVLTFISTHAGASSDRLLAGILDRFFESKDQTQYALANAITALARDTKDPHQRWNLEALGGALLTAVLPKGPRDKASARADVIAEEPVPVG
jgi:hypothetical protein